MPSRFLHQHRTLAVVLLSSLLANAAGYGFAEPRSVHPALRSVHPGEALSERFLTHDRVKGVMVNVIVEGTVTADALRSRGMEVNTVAGGFMTVRCPLGLLDRLISAPGIDRVQISERCKPLLDRSAPDVGVNTVRTVTPPTFTGQTGAGVLVGDVDTGIDYLNPDFQNPDGTTRLVSIWDQTGAGTPPSGFSYGVEWLPADINAQIPSEIDSEGHGTHVLGIAGGNGSNTGNGQPAYTFVGMAPQADLCMVKTTFQTGAIVDGVNYIFQKAASLGKQAVVNLSLGTQEGPHDGTLDMDVMLNALTGPGRIIVASAGNAGGDKLHGQLTLSGSTPQNMTLTVPAYTSAPGTANDLLLFSGWYAGTSQISVKIVTPTGITLGPVVTGTNLSQGTADGWLDIHNATSLPSNNAHEIYIQLYDATASFPPKTGTWTFTFTPVSIPGGGRVDMYLYENALANGNAALAVWNQGLAAGGVVGSPGEADSVITAAAHVTKDCWESIDGGSYCWNPHPTPGAIAFFSSQGPRRDGVLKPDLSAPGFGVTSTLSVDYLVPTPYIETDGVHVIQAGTSMSAPHITGATALLLARSEWANSTPSKIKARLRSTARADGFTGTVPNATWGYGKLDIGAALQIPLTLAVARPPKGSLYVAGRYDSVNVALTGFTADTIGIALSMDGGATYPVLLGSLFNVPPTGQPGFTFFVDPSYQTTQAKVRAVAIKGTTVLTSFSDSLFAIGIPAAVQAESPGVPARFALHPNTPNPFNPSTTIHFELDRAGPATLRIYSVTGALVRTLVDSRLPAGHFRAPWDGTDAQGRPVGSGVYVYRLSENGRNLSRKMSLLK